MHYSLNSPFERYQEQRGLLFSLMGRLLSLAEALEVPSFHSEIQYRRDLFDSYSLKILVAGELNSGKSTIANALLKTKALPAYPVPTTALLTQVKRGGRAMALLHHHPASDGIQQPPLEMALTDIERHLVIDHRCEPTRDFARIELHLPLPLRYSGIEISDPISSWDDDGYEKSLMSEAPAADAILYALDSNSLPSKEEALRIDWLCGAGHATLLFLCNRFDLVEPHNHRLVKQRYAAYLSQLLHGNEDFIFFTDAKSALESYLHNDLQRLGQSQWPAVEAALYESLARGSGEQSILQTVASLQSQVSGTRRIISLKRRLQQASPQERNTIRAELLRQCKQLEISRQHIADQFDAARQNIGKEAKTAAIAFYSLCLNTLEYSMQRYTPRQTDSLWQVFSGDSSERLAKDIITFLTETVRTQFQAWITTILEPLVEEKLPSLKVELLEDLVRQVTQAVERRVNCAWHPFLLIKRMLEIMQLEVGSDLEKMKSNVAQMYWRVLNQSSVDLVDTITGSIDAIICQKQQELDHRLKVELQCLNEVVRASVAAEQAQAYEDNDATMRLLADLENELDAIERALVEVL
jgi:GTPase SAR1 family protein